MSDARHPRTLVELRAVYKVVETISHDAIVMSLSTPASRRGTEMIALHTTIPDRLVQEGVAVDRAVELAKGIWVTVEIADDAN